MSNLDVAVWVKMAQSLLGFRVDNAHVVNEALLLKLRRGGDVKFLVLEPGVRVHLTTRVSSLGEASRGFPLIVKSHLRDHRLMGVEQLGFDRVLRLKFSNGVSLYAELIPRGFLVLVDEGNLVVAASRYAEMRDRVVKVKVEYKPPPLQTINPFTLTPEEVASRVTVGSDMVRGLIKGLGLPGEVAEEVLHRVGIPLDAKPRDMSLSSYEAVSSELSRLYAESMEGRGYLALREGAPVEATPFKPTRFPEGSVVELSTLDEALDELFSRRLSTLDRLIEEERVKLERSLAEARELESRYRLEAEARRAEAEIIARNYGLLESIVDCVRGRWRLRDLSPCRGVVGVDFSSGVYEIEVEGVRVKLNYREDIQEAIVRLYREAGELEGKARRAGEAVREALSKLAELELKVKARLVAEKAKARRVAWFERFRWTITSSGLLAIGGRDASQNESLVRRYLEDNDVFLHADIQGASAVVLKTRGLEPKVEDVEDAAVIAACYSKAWKIGLGSIDVYWVRGDQVSKSAPPGEYLRTGSFMIYGERRYMRGVRLQLALGLVLNGDGNPLLMVGSERVVRRASLAYVIVSPGDMSVDDSSLVKEALVKVLEDDDKPLAMALNMDQIKPLLPGKFRIMRVDRGEGRGVDLEMF